MQGNIADNFYIGSMRLPLIMIVLFAVACGQRPQPPAKNDEQPPDTVRQVQTAVMDTTKALPASSSRDTSHLPKLPRHSANYIADLNNDGLPDTITLASSKGVNLYFDTVSISLAGFGKQTFSTTDPWTIVDYDDSTWAATQNAIPTNMFFLSRSKRHSVILLFGELDGAGDRDNFSIINIENNRASLVLEQNKRKIHIEAPISLSDLNDDGRLDFVYRQIFEYDGRPDTLGGMVGTYSPYFVYTVDDSCLLNKPLTIWYNKKYYVFAGFRYDEHIDVFYPNDKSQPRLWKDVKK